MIYCTGPALVFPENFFAGAGRGARLEELERVYSAYTVFLALSLSLETRESRLTRLAVCTN